MPHLTYYSRIEVHIKLDGVDAVVLIDTADVREDEQKGYAEEYARNDKAMIDRAKAVAQQYGEIKELNAQKPGKFGKGAGTGLLPQESTVKEVSAPIDDCFYTKSTDGKTTYIRVKPTNSRYTKYGIAFYEDTPGYAELADAIDREDIEYIDTHVLVYDDNGGKPRAIRIDTK